MRKNPSSTLRAADLIREFNELIEAKSNHPLHSRLSYPHRDKVLKVAKDMSWIQVWDQMDKLTLALATHGGKRGGPLSKQFGTGTQGARLS